MRESIKRMRKDILQRLVLVAVLIAIALGGAALGVGGWPNLLGVLVAALGAVTLLWVLDPALQDLIHAEDGDEEV